MGSTDAVQATQFGFHYPSPGEVIAAGATLPVIAIVLFAIRMSTRLATYKSSERPRAYADDWLSLVSLVGLMYMGVLLIIGVEKGVFAYPSPADIEVTALNVEPAWLALNQKLVFAYYLGQDLTVGFVKLGFLFFLRRLFVREKKTVLSKITVALAILIAVWTLAFALAFILDCAGHVDVNWAAVKPKREYCHSQFPTYEGWAISDFILDLMVLSLPFPIIWSVPLILARRVALMFVFLIAWLAIAAATVRMVLFIREYEGGEDEKRANIELVITLTLYWSMIEAGVSWIAACLPSFGDVIAKMMKHEQSSSLHDAFRHASLPSTESDVAKQGPSGRKAARRDSRCIDDVPTKGSDLTHDVELNDIR